MELLSSIILTINISPYTITVTGNSCKGTINWEPKFTFLGSQNALRTQNYCSQSTLGTQNMGAQSALGTINLGSFARVTCD